MSEQILDKIKYTCKVINKVEWSGILFYSIEGTIADPDNMRIILQDIYLMDKGNKVYTSYAFGPDVVDYFMHHPEAMGWQIGHIHSHNDMDVFFSGTDMDELNDNAPSHNYYLSLIVNNWMDFKAKIASIGEANVEQVVYNVKGENGTEYQIEGDPISKQVLFIRECEIVTPIDQGIKVSEEYDLRLQEIIRVADRKAEEEKKKATTVANQRSTMAEKYSSQTNTVLGNRGFALNSWNHLRDPYNEMMFEDGLIKTGSTDFTVKNIDNETEQFAAHVLRLGNPTTAVEEEGEGEIEAALDDLFNSEDINYNSLAASIVEMYSALYEQFYDTTGGNYEGFMEVLDDVIAIFEGDEAIFPEILSPIIMSLKSYRTELNKQML